MPFIPYDFRQERGGDAAQQWLRRLRSGSRLTASLPPLLDATQSFMDRIRAPGDIGWQQRQAAGLQSRGASGSYLDAPGRGAMPSPVSSPTASQRIPSVRSAIASLRPPVAPQGFPGMAAAPTPGESTGRAGLSGRVAAGNLGQSLMPPATPYLQPLQEGGAPSADGGFISGVGKYLTSPGVGQAMTAAGGAMLAGGDPTFGGSLGAGLQGFAAERARFQTSEAARRKAAQAGQTTPQELRNKQDTVVAMLTQNQIPQDRWDGYLARVVTQEGYEGVLDELAPPEAVGLTDLEEEQEKLGWFLGLTPEQQARMVEEGLTPEQRESYNLMRRNPPAGTTVNIEGDQAATPVGPMQEGMDAFIQGVYNGRATTFNNTLPSLQNVDQTLKLVNDPRFNEVAGVWSGNPIANALLRYQGDPELLALLGTFERLGSDRALAILRNFTGAKSDFEFKVSEKMAAKDRSMTPAELKAMLELMRRAYIQEAVRWAQDMVYMGEDVQIEGDYAPVQARFMSDAQGILDQYGAEERSWREDTDPLGLGYS